MKSGIHSSPASDEFEGQLRGSERKVTGPRRAILSAMRDLSHPATARQIRALLPGGCCDLATVYRSLHLLEQMRLAKRFDFGDGAARFELVRDQVGKHHHHLICTACTRIVEIEDCFPPRLETRIARDNRFKEITHKLEFFGICPDCQEK